MLMNMSLSNRKSRRKNTSIYLCPFFLKLSSRNFDSLLGSAPVALAIFAAGTSNLSNLAELALRSRLRESLSFLEPELKIKMIKIDSGLADSR